MYILLYITVYINISLVVLRLVAEVDEVVGDDLFVSHEHTTCLTYMGQVFKETLRRYPPASATAREPPCDTEIEGYVIPKGTFTTVRVHAFKKNNKIMEIKQAKVLFTNA